MSLIRIPIRHCVFPNMKMRKIDLDCGEWPFLTINRLSGYLSRIQHLQMIVAPEIIIIDRFPVKAHAEES